MEIKFNPADQDDLDGVAKILAALGVETAEADPEPEPEEKPKRSRSRKKPDPEPEPEEEEEEPEEKPKRSRSRKKPDPEPEPEDDDDDDDNDDDVALEDLQEQAAEILANFGRPVLAQALKKLKAKSLSSMDPEDYGKAHAYLQSIIDGEDE